MIKNTFNDWEYLHLDRGEGVPTVFILHGYGANALDLAGLANYLDPSGNFSWVFPEAPIQLPMMSNARAWFPIDEQAIQRSMMTGEPRDFRGQVVEEMARLTSSLTQLIESFNCTKGFLVGGFSQGAMMSLHLHTKLSTQPMGLLLLSSAVVSEKDLSYIPDESLPVLVTHGRQDMVIPFSEGEYVASQLKESGYEVEFFSFDGGHEINLGAIERIKNFLSTVI